MLRLCDFSTQRGVLYLFWTLSWYWTWFCFLVHGVLYIRSNIKYIDTESQLWGVKRLLVLLLFIQVITVTFFFSRAFHEVSWYMTIYIVGAYLRLWAGDWAKDLRFAGRWLVIFVLMAWLSVAAIDFAGYNLHKGSWQLAHYFVNDSSKILAFVISVSVFLFFKNLPLPHSRFINTVAKSTFGVLLIHANSDAMRTMLWKHIVKVPEMVAASLPELVFHAVVWAVVIFSVCSIIDYCRLRWVERPVMNYIYEHSEVIEKNVGIKKMLM